MKTKIVKKSKRTVVHKLYRDGWSEYPWESEYVACTSGDTASNPELTTDDKYVTCKNCLRTIKKWKEGSI